MWKLMSNNKVRPLEIDGYGQTSHNKSIEMICKSMVRRVIIKVFEWLPPVSSSIHNGMLPSNISIFLVDQGGFDVLIMFLSL